MLLGVNGISKVYLVYGRASYVTEISDKKSEEENPLPDFVTEEQIGYLSHKKAQQKFAALESGPSHKRWHWKNLTLTCVAASPHIEAVSFIPNDIRCSQTLFARRAQEPDQTGFIAPSDFSKYIEQGKVFWITDEETLLQTTKHIDGSFVGEVRKVLRIFQRDKETLAIALTFNNGDGPVTQIWGKGMS